jgi:hypothetical protein
MGFGDDPVGDERLQTAAAAHYDVMADVHDTAAMGHERRGERADAKRERALARDARGKAKRLRDQVRVSQALRRLDGA